MALADPQPPTGSLPEESHFAAAPPRAYDHAALTKNKSTSNLLSQRAPAPIDTAKRMSIDAGQLDRLAM